MTHSRSLFACLVHDQRDCVADLVSNLAHLEGRSPVLLYNGGQDSSLLGHGYGGSRCALVHPSPRPQCYGRLHEFALDCMRYALGSVEFDAVTFVDSDQLLVQPGYSTEIEGFLDANPDVGLLGSAAGPQPRRTRIYPAAQAWAERDLWCPLLRRFPGGDEKFPHWTFWPGTVITASAARELVELFDSDDKLADIMRRTRLFATEEVVLPTLVALLGYKVAVNPCSYDYVRYRATYTRGDLRRAIDRDDVYWVHPIPRRYDDPLRTAVREHFDNYVHSAPVPSPRPAAPPLLRTAPILAGMRDVEGWLDDEEGDLLIAATARAMAEVPRPAAVVEAGSHCGRGTVVLAMTVRAAAPGTRVWSIDAHDGVVGALDGKLERRGPTRGKLERNLERAGVRGLVEVVEAPPHKAPWSSPVGFLLIDALHDYPSVARDFAHFEPWLVDGAYVAFHDYADYFPAVKALVHELLEGGRYEEVDRAGTLIVLRRRQDASAGGQLALELEGASSANPPATPARAPAPENGHAPLVSCVLPTCDRPALAAQAIAYFLRQELTDAELVVVDDGDQAIEDLLSDAARVRHIRLGRRHTIGAKRNLGCEAARGDLIAHWDDDDWNAPWRLSYQVGELAGDGADVCGLSRLHYFEPTTGRAWIYAWPADARPWISDGTLLYTRDFWRRNPFPDSSMGVDCRFLWNSRRKRVLTLPNDRFYVAMIHPGNTSPKHTDHAPWRPEPADVVHALLGEDLAFHFEALSGAVSQVLTGR